MGIAINDRGAQPIPASQPTRLRVDGSGSLRTVDYYSAVGAGIIQGASFAFGFGNNGDIHTVDLPEDVWSGGGLYTWLAAATVLEAVSDSASDTGAGVGARTIRIDGLNASYVETSITITLNGTTPVSLVTPLLRVNRVVALTAGTSGTNVGTVIVRAPAGATIGHMPVGYGSTRSSNYTVPLGKTLLLTAYTMSINRPSTARDASLVSYVRQYGAAYTLSNEVSIDGNPFSRLLVPSIPIPERADFILRCTYVSATNTDVTASWSGILRVND